jgi:DNA primase
MSQPFDRSGFQPIYRTELKRCPMCDHKDNCSVSRSREVLICARVRSDHQAKDGRWTHILRGAATAAPAIRLVKPPIETRRADNYIAHAIYSAVLLRLSLLPMHRDDLQRRGLSLSVIEREQFKSTPTDEEARDITAEIAESCDLSGVPGFFRRAVFEMVKTPSGFFIPVRDRDGLIRGLQIRKDNLRHAKDNRYQWFSSGSYPQGITSGSPCHVQHVERIKRTGQCLITEGALKAIVAGEYLSSDFGGLVALAGVSTFQESFGSHLKSAWPELHTVNIAFDRDWQQKPEVKRQLLRLIQSLKDAGGLAINVLTWEQEKGIDDFLLSESYEIAEVA